MDAVVDAAALPDGPAGSYGVQIALGLPARLRERIVFLIELRYRVNVQLQGVAAADIPALLYVQVPNAVFPTLKTIIEQNGAFAGYPEITLQTIDFAGLFQARARA